MSKDAAELLARALQLPAEARAALADSLMDSLDPELDEGAEEAWRIEIARRMEELNSGAVQPIPWDEVRRELRTRLRA